MIKANCRRISELSAIYRVRSSTDKTWDIGDRERQQGKCPNLVAISKSSEMTTALIARRISEHPPESDCGITYKI
jgi:hypothetical protein